MSHSKVIKDVDIRDIKKNSSMNKGYYCIEIPKGTTYIGSNAFHSHNLKEVKIPSSVSLISFNAFFGNQIRTIKFEEGVEVIKQGAFADNALTSIVLPNSLKEVGEAAFGYGGNYLTEITIGDNVLIASTNSFGWYGDSFKKLYDTEKKGGKYYYFDGKWNLK